MQSQGKQKKEPHSRNSGETRSRDAVKAKQQIASPREVELPFNFSYGNSRSMRARLTLLCRFDRFSHRKVYRPSPQTAADELPGAPCLFWLPCPASLPACLASLLHTPVHSLAASGPSCKLPRAHFATWLATGVMLGRGRAQEAS
eukprot:6186481-Pleurochrysis_carterae.AAC.6